MPLPEHKGRLPFSVSKTLIRKWRMALPSQKERERGTRRIVSAMARVISERGIRLAEEDYKL